MRKIAYPQGQFQPATENPHDLRKWMTAMHEMYALAQNGEGLQGAFEKVTSDWDAMEKLDFKGWMAFYEENAHKKYKTAQFKSPGFIENGHGSFIPNMDNLKANIPLKAPDMADFAPQVSNEEEKKEQTRKKIQSIIGRLSAAEKLATHPDVLAALRRTVQIGVDEWLNLLGKLKREIQLAPMRATSASLLEDIIYKNANQALAAGNKKAAILLVKVAQAMPTPAPLENPMGAPLMNPGDVPMGGQPVGAQETVMNKFLENLNGDDFQEAEDGELEDSDELVVSEDDDGIQVTAQAAPLPSPNGVPDQAPAIEVSEDQPLEAVPPGSVAPADLAPVEPAPVPAKPEADDLEDPFDAALANVKISDIVTRLEGIASLFKNRQIARQLAIIDLMMDRTGIAPFFPNLAEAMKSALESNQYCQTRVEEILAKLRGTMVTPMSEQLENDMDTTQNEAAKNEVVVQNLAKEEAAEKDRKEKRKKEQAEIEQIPVAPTEVQQPLAAPVEVQSAPPVRPVG